MLSSSFLDIAIGIVFVFLLLSLIASTINEIILSFLNMRGKTLLRGLETLLNDTGLKADGLVARVYNHGQVFGLFEGNFEPQKPSKLPSYIPPKNFAAALLDVVLEAAAALPVTSPPVLVPTSPPMPTPEQVAQAAAQAAQQAAEVAGRLSMLGSPPTPPDQVAAAQAAAIKAAAVARMASLRLAAIKLAGNEATRKVGVPLLSMINSAATDMAALEKSVEAWYNSAMDRVSGWYRYHTQKVLLGIGILLAIGLNADTVNIVQQLSKNPTLRESVVAAAQAAAAEKKSEQTNKASQGSASGQGSNPSPDQASSPDQNHPPNNPPKEEKSDQGAGPDLGKQVQNVSEQISKVQGLGIPLGWPPLKPLKPNEHVGWFCRAWQDARPVLERPTTYIGWLLTAIAVSLGAPFWFDMLNKIMVVRSTIKPGEKSSPGRKK